jgi:hypothetical protein
LMDKRLASDRKIHFIGGKRQNRISVSIQLSESDVRRGAWLYFQKSECLRKQILRSPSRFTVAG